MEQPIFPWSHTLLYFHRIRSRRRTGLGVIYDPNRKELSCRKRKRNFLNDKRVVVSSCDTLKNALMLTGFAYDRHEKAILRCTIFNTLYKMHAGS